MNPNGNAELPRGSTRDVGSSSGHQTIPLDVRTSFDRPSSILGSTPPSPALPVRSPLRPRPRALSSAPQLHMSFMQRGGSSLFTRDDTPLPSPPAKAPALSRLDYDLLRSTSLSQHMGTDSRPRHALLELLSSERAFASDLSLIRDVHIPLALGGPAPFVVVPPPMSPSGSGSSSRTVSTASDSSTTSSQLGPPMSTQDARIIFGNVADLAVFANEFSERIEEALGDALEGGVGPDAVGALFLQVAPTLEPLFKTYCTRHESSIEHLESLPRTPALEQFLAQTQTLAASFSHSWNLNSLLIKPIQRLLKYSLLLGAIISATPDSHPDMANLQQAKIRMEEISRGVNEQARRHAVVKEVLTAKKGEVPKKKGITVGVAASVSMSRMKSVRNVGKTKEGSEEMAVVDQMEKEIRRVQSFVEKLAKDAVGWSVSVKALTERLRTWGLSFGQMMGLEPGDQQADAFDAFIDLVEASHIPLCDMAIATVEDILLVEFAQLIKSMASPFQLISAMQTLQPLHHGLLNMNFSAKNRPPPALLEASQSYIALRSQLASELPQYLVLLNKGVLRSVHHLVHIQAAFADRSHMIWSDMWNRLRREGENAPSGAEETISIFINKFVDATADIQQLTCTNSRKIYVDKPKMTPRSSPTAVKTMIHSLEPAPPSLSPTSLSPSTTSVLHMMSALNPGHAPQAISPSSSYKSKVTAWQTYGHKASSDSLNSRGSGKSRANEFGEFYIAEDVPLPPKYNPTSQRTRSMPVPSAPMPLRASTSTTSSRDTAPPSYHDRDDRGRSSAKPPSNRRKNTESSRHRSPSAKSTSSSRPSREHDLMPAAPRPVSPASMQASWANVQAKYYCRAVSNFYPPRGSNYHNLPVLDLELDCVVSVLKELGHPSLHLNLPFKVDDGEDCLLLVRDERGLCGFALASFLMPTDY